MDNSSNIKKPRLTYLDILRGLCMIWVVWIHTHCPEFANYPFRLASMFFISGTLFKERSWSGFWRKKTNQIFVPFVFFYLVYYVYLIGSNYLKYRTVSAEMAMHILDVFGLYSGNDGFVVNYPLWFILALFWHQLWMQTLVKLTRRTWVKALAILAVTVAGVLWVKWMPTPLIIGRAMTYFVFYGFGCLLSNATRNVICTSSGLKYCPAFLGAWLALMLARTQWLGLSLAAGTLLQDVELFLLCYGLLQLAFAFQHSPAVKWLGFFGRNSIILYGFHDMILSVLHIAIGNLVGPMTIGLGFVALALTLLISVPLIFLLTKYTPTLVAKKPLLRET